MFNGSTEEWFRTTVGFLIEPPQGTKWRSVQTKVMTNNPNGFQREIKIKGQRLKEVENFNYLGTIISKIIWKDKNISFASNV